MPSVTTMFVLCLMLFIAGYEPTAAQARTALTDSIHGTKDSLSPKQDVVVTRSSLADSLVQYAFSFLGDRYRRGGTGSRGFDCSGYTMRVFGHLGIHLPHTSAGQGLAGTQVPRSNIRKGDLVLFKGRSRRSRRIGHVGIVISAKGEPIRFIHSSNSDGVRIDRLESDYYRYRFVKAVRVPGLFR